VKPLTTSCLISNYNYAPYVGEAVDGALQQTAPIDEIIVVDDGSADGSVDLLRRRYSGQPRVKIIDKPNEGQLSCFNVGAELASGDVVFFLDADDVYEPQYVEQALSAYDRYASCDFLFCGRRFFGHEDRIERRFTQDHDFGYTVLRAAYLREWVGASTSCISMRRRILQKILPLPFVDEWRVRADDCLVFGASLAGAHKRCLAQPLVRYRVHQHNCFRGRRADAASSYRRRLAINRLIEHFERQLCYNLPKLAEDHHREFCTIEQPSLGDIFKYFRIGRRAGVSRIRRLACLAEMIRYHVGARSRCDGDGQVTVPPMEWATSTSPAISPEESPPNRDQTYQNCKRRRVA
jgi:glycosyltransferase involved in cell wall biosynthesis